MPFGSPDCVVNKVLGLASVSVDARALQAISLR